MMMIGFTQHIQLAAKLFQQQGKVMFVSRSRKFPVDVDSVEQASRRNAICNIALDEEVDAGCSQLRTSRGRSSSSGKTFRVCLGGASQRDHDFQVGMKLL